MNSLSRTIAPLTLCGAVFGAGLANAATISTTGNFTGFDNVEFYSGEDGIPDPGESSYLIAASSSVVGLQQFDPTLGTLTGVTLSTNFTVSVSGEVEVDSIDSSIPHSAKFEPWDGYNSGVSTVITFFTTPTSTISLAYAGTEIAPSCTGIDFGCVGSDSYSFVFGDESWINGNTLEKIGLANLLGTGALTGLAVSSYHPSSSSKWELDNVDAEYAYGFIETAVGAGDVTLTYEYTPTPVPVPAAVWLFASGIAGLLGFAKRKAA